jgi:hypothetical protein
MCERSDDQPWSPPSNRKRNKIVTFLGKVEAHAVPDYIAAPRC